MLLFLVFNYLALSVALFFIFRKAKVKAWKALIPGLNAVIWCRLIGRPTHFALLLLVPIVHFFILAGMLIDLVRSFGLLKYYHSFLAVVFAPYYLLYLGLNKKDRYQHPILTMEQSYAKKIKEAKSLRNLKRYKKLLYQNPYRKSTARDWLESITFAVFAAAFIRLFFIEAYAIPTSSMEGSLLVGDHLFVSKMHYGIRTPRTVAMIPLLHNRVPIFDRESYLKKPSLPYFRLPGVESIDVGDPIVFNWPVGDSTYLGNGRNYSAHQVRTYPSLLKELGNKALVTRPIDKRDHYIKRCLGTPGDTLQIIDRVTYVNGVLIPDSRETLFKYVVKSPTGVLNLKLLERLGIHLDDSPFPPSSFHLSAGQVEALQQKDPTLSIQLIPGHSDDLFPHDEAHFDHWSIDNYGPLYIPKKNATIDLTLDNIALYQRIIRIYENNDLAIKDRKIIINGVLTNQYTFQQNYYWGMGDNRHNSEDSRSWGFIPEDHIVGKPIFIHFSTKDNSLAKGVRWDSLFTSTTKY